MYGVRRAEISVGSVCLDSRKGTYSTFTDSTVLQSFTGRPRSKFRKKIRRAPT
jgi:hypothetical protein